MLFCSGIVVKCHTARELDQNRKNARKMLIEKLDDHYNGEMSIRAQMERIAMKKSKEYVVKQKRLMDMKKKYKDLVNSSVDSDSENSSGSKKEEEGDKHQNITSAESKSV